MKIELTRMRLKKIIRKMQSTNILVLGDLMLDDFIWGKVSRISPEAPVPVVLVTKESAYPGGAANVGRNLADFGIKTEMCGMIGRDFAGDRLLELLKKDRIGARGILRKKDFPTIRKSRIIARTQQVVRVDREMPYRLEKKLLEKLFSFLQRAIPRVDAVILEDYGKGFITQELADMVIALARRYKKIITVDPNPHNPLRWDGATVIKPNKSEAFAALGITSEEEPKNWESIGRALIKKWNVQSVLLTLGEGGMMLFHPPHPPYHVPTRAKEVFDVSGAGDTAIAFFTAALAAKLDAHSAAEIANHAAGVVVGKLGTATLTPDELLASLE
ncbi:MAG: D-glycero-beta-D-manno-heptose-7-phosphate kinase [Verrucomicrobiota bacterium]